MIATSIGWTMYGSPDLRDSPSCDSSANSAARRTRSASIPAMEPQRPHRGAGAHRARPGEWLKLVVLRPPRPSLLLLTPLAVRLLRSRRNDSGTIRAMSMVMVSRPVASEATGHRCVHRRISGKLANDDGRWVLPCLFANFTYISSPDATTVCDSAGADRVMPTRGTAVLGWTRGNVHSTVLH